jgi:nitrite reductase/ring-hydroxylating ferredoxin subunit
MSWLRSCRVCDAAVLLTLLMLRTLQGQVSNKCIVCPAHNTAFDLATGEAAAVTPTALQAMCGPIATLTFACPYA